MQILKLVFQEKLAEALQYLNLQISMVKYLSLQVKKKKTLVLVES
jgi:hypothetical protein